MQHLVLFKDAVEKVKKSKETEKDEEESPSAEDDDQDDDLRRNEGSSYATQIGGRPMFPTADIPISMTFGSTRPRGVLPPSGGQAHGHKSPTYPKHGGSASVPSTYSNYGAKPMSSNIPSRSPVKTEKSQQQKEGLSTYTSGFTMLTPVQNIFKNPLELITKPFRGQGQSQQSKPPPHNLHPLPFRSPGPESNNFNRNPEKVKKNGKLRSQPKPKPTPSVESKVPKKSDSESIPVVGKHPRFPPPGPESSNSKQTKNSKSKGSYTLTEKNKKVKRVT